MAVAARGVVRATIDYFEDVFLAADGPTLKRAEPLVLRWAVVFAAASFFFAVFTLKREWGADRASRAALAAIAACACAVWFKDASERRWAREAFARGERGGVASGDGDRAKGSLLMKKVCQNCEHEFPSQSPRGGHKYECERCGLVSKKPKIVQRVDRGVGGGARGVAAPASSEDLRSAAKADGGGPKATSRTAEEKRAAAKAAKQRTREEREERDAEEAADRAELQRLIEEERARKAAQRRAREEEEAAAAAAAKEAAARAKEEERAAAARAMEE